VRRPAEKLNKSNHKTAAAERALEDAAFFLAPYPIRSDDAYRKRSLYQSIVQLTWPRAPIVQGVTTNGRITALDGWRGISILCVVAAHLFGRRYSSHPDADFPNIASVLSMWGVDIFFVISGFIITRLALQEYDAKGRFSIRDFYIRRLLRILPPLYTYLLFILIASTSGYIVQTYSGIFSAAIFTCNFPNAQCGWFPGHSWTLAYEEQFYLVFPIIFFFFGRRVHVIAAALFLFLMMFPFVRFFLRLGSLWREIAEFAPSFSFISGGVVLATFEQKFVRLISNQRAFYVSIPIYACLMVLLLSGSNVKFTPGSTGAYMQLGFTNCLLPICFLWIIGSTAFRDTWIKRLLDHPCLQFFGKVSYSLYIWQMAFTAAPSLYLERTWLLFSPLMLLMAALSYYLVERPSIRFGKHLLGGSRAMGSTS